MQSTTTAASAPNVSPNTRAQLQRRRYSSVKYNRLLSSKELEQCFIPRQNTISSSTEETASLLTAANNNVQQTRSNPVIYQNFCNSPGCATAPITVGPTSGGTVTPSSTKTTSFDRKSSGSSARLAVIQEPTLSVSYDNKRYLNKISCVTPPVRNHQQSRQKHLAIAPPSLHISFDVADSASRMNDHADMLPLSLSSDNFRRYDYRPHQSSSPQNLSSSPSPLRRSNEMPRQKMRQATTTVMLEHSEIAEISSNYMRLSGAMQQFRGILSAPEKTTSFGKTISQSTENDSTCPQILNNDGTGDGRGPPKFAIGDFKKSISRNQSEETAKHSTASEHAQSLKFQVNYRLRRRNELFEMRRKMCDYSFAIAILGIILMIVENELTASHGYREYKASKFSYCLKSLIVMFTLILLALIIAYHALEVKLFMSDNGCEDWRIAVNNKRIIQVCVELFACALCPIPGEFYFTWRTVHADGHTVTSAEVPVDVLLSIPMFSRFYLICRVTLLHSKLFTDASSRSIGALNRINFTAKFVLKTLMTMSPGTVLLSFTFTCWLIAAWIMRLCERWHQGEPINVEASKFQNYLNSLWLIAITSLTIGYGDIVPNTYCGRAVSVICGIMGAGTSSLVVAVVAKKLELSRAEKHVHTFMIDSQLTKRLKNAAANVLRETWFIYKNRKLVEKIDPAKIRVHQRKFLVAIYEMRKVKRDLRKLNENSTTVSDMAKQTSDTYEIVADMRTWQDVVESKVISLERQYNNLEFQMQQMNVALQKLPGLICRRLLQEISDIPRMSTRGSSLSLNEPVQSTTQQ